MNIIPSISKRFHLSQDIGLAPVADAGPYTVVGGEVLDREQKELPGLSIVLLNRGGRPFRRDLFEELCKLGAREVISVESSPCPYDVELLSKRHSKLRFMIFSEESSPGAQIDAAFREALSDHIFVLHGDMKITASTISSRVFSKIAERNRLCAVPVFRDPEGEELPTAIGPSMGRNGAFETQPSAAGGREAPTLCAWDYSGIYRRERHFAIGGFDAQIREPWWQKLDYGLRAWLWGEEIRTHPALRVSYMNEPPSEDLSSGPGYRRFFLKTLAVKRRGDNARLPRSSWAAYRRSSGESAALTRETYREIRRWVDDNRFRFVIDAAQLTELWDWGNQ